MYMYINGNVTWYMYKVEECDTACTCTLMAMLHGTCIKSRNVILHVHLCFIVPQGELELIQTKSREAGAFDAIICSHWAHGGRYLIHVF